MIEVRLAKSGEIAGISSVLAKSWRFAYRGIVSDSYLDTLPDEHWVSFLTSALEGDSIFSMILIDGGEIAGASILGKSEKEKEIHLISLYLMPDKISKGLGRLFYSAVEREIIARGYKKCVLDVLENNSRAIGFYKARGFAQSGTKSSAVLGDISYPCLFFEKALEQ